jgi:hypothetical protein
MPEEATLQDVDLMVIPLGTTEVIIPPEREIAYVIKDKYFSGFEVQKSDSGWWMDRTKVEKLIQSFKNGYNIKEACIYTGISDRQYQYFIETHPEFCSVKEACELVCNMIAETGNFSLLSKGDGSQVRWFLERAKPMKYGRPMGGGDGQVLNNFGNIFTTPMPIDNLKPSVKARILERRDGPELSTT